MSPEFEELKEAAVVLITQLGKAAAELQGFVDNTRRRLGDLERSSDKTEGQEIVFVVTYKDAKGAEQVIHVIGIDVSGAVVAARKDIEAQSVIVSVRPGPK